MLTISPLYREVLILILMEHAQRDIAEAIQHYINRSLNPYFNGTCSKRISSSAYLSVEQRVLILILMEHAQRVLGEILQK